VILMIRLATILCARRHAVRVKAYEHREGTSTARVEQLLTAEVPHRCPQLRRLRLPAGARAHRVQDVGGGGAARGEV
jgi:hypothetical protein